MGIFPCFYAVRSFSFHNPILVIVVPTITSLIRVILTMDDPPHILRSELTDRGCLRRYKIDPPYLRKSRFVIDHPCIENPILPGSRQDGVPDGFPGCGFLWGMVDTGSGVSRGDTIRR